MTAQDLYPRHTDTSGHSTIREHRGWDVDLFLKSQQDAAFAANKKESSDKAKIEIVTRADYKASRR